MDAVFDQRWVCRLEGIRVKQIDNKWDQAMALMADIENFRAENDCDRLVMVWCGSTEAFQEPSAVHETVEAFELGLRTTMTTSRRASSTCTPRFSRACRSPTVPRTCRPICRA